MPATKTRARHLRTGQRITLAGKTGTVAGVTRSLASYSVRVTWTHRGVAFSRDVNGSQLIETHGR